jgi:transcriptional regulator GlxA family with amidase domain
VTAGGVTSWQELAIYLVARFCRLNQAIETAKVHLLARHEVGQLPFAVCRLPFAAMNRTIDDSDAAIAKSQRWISANYATANSVARMAEVSGLDARAFARWFKAAAGHSAIDYVQLLQVDEAKQLLEGTHLPADDIGNTVGYSDPANQSPEARRWAAAQSTTRLFPSAVAVLELKKASCRWSDARWRKAVRCASG